MTKTLRFALALLIAITSIAKAQGTATPPWTRQTVNSAKLGEERPVLVVTPDGYAKNAERYPVLVLLDANDVPQFSAAIANIQFLASRNAIPQMIIVGIPNTKDRTHDLTPTPSGATAKAFPTAGGANALADFLSDEVLPMIRANYRTRPTTILAGHSFGGLFALHVAANRPGAYTGIIAMSPALWWNDTTSATDYANAIAKSASATRVFATSGGLERQIDRSTQRFKSRLDSIKPATLAFAYRHYDDDTHGLTPVPSLMDGLRFVFAPVSITALPIDKLGPQSDSAAVVKAIVETEQQYARGARSLGLPEVLPEQVLNGLGYNVLNELKKTDLAIWVFKRNVALYPESANVYDSLGDGYLAKSDTANAKTQFARAVDVATRTGHPVLAESRSKLEKLQTPVQAGKQKP